MRLKVRCVLSTTITLLVFLASFSIFSSCVKAQWLSGWTYRKSHTINGGPGAGTNYQVKIVVHSGSGTDSGEDVYLNGNSANWPDDIRFTDNDGFTELDHWLESSDANTATFWVEARDNLDNDRTIYIYYGNGGASSASNGANTFNFFDDFPGAGLSSTWQVNANDYSVSGGALRINIGAVTLVNPLSFNLNDGYILEGRIIYHSTASNYGGTLSAQSSQYTRGSNGGSDATNLYMRGSGSTNVRRWTGSGSASSYDCGSSNVFTSTDDTWYVLGAKFYSGGVYLTRDRTQEWSYGCNWVKNIVYISLGAFHGSASYNIQDTSYDWVLVRKYASTEPTHGSWGGEEVVTELGPQITSLYFSTTLDQIYINWVTEDEVGTINVECTLNGVQNCDPFPYSGEPGSGGCTIVSPQYNMTPDPGGELKTVSNTLYCKAYDPVTYDPLDPSTYSETTRVFYPLAFEVSMPSSMSLVVGEEQNFVITVKNSGSLSDTYSMSVTTGQGEILIIENGDQTTETLDTNDIQQIYVGINVLSSEETAFAGVEISSDTSKLYTEIKSDQTLTVKGGVKSLPDFSFFGIVQIMFIAAAALVSFLF